MLAQLDIEGGLREAWRDAATYVPKLLLFLVILLVGFIVAKLLSRLTDSLLERVGFDRWVERGGMQAAFERAKTDASDLVALIVFWAVILVTLQLAFGIWGPNPISELIEGLIDYLPNVLAAVLILVIAAAVARVVTDVLMGFLGGATGGRWIARTAGIAILIVGVFAALDQLEIAPAIVTGLFYALLVVVAGSLAIAFGVGGIPIARRYLEEWSSRADRTVGEIRAVRSTTQTSNMQPDDATAQMGTPTPPPPPRDEVAERA
jgi:Conserved TM helix